MSKCTILCKYSKSARILISLSFFFFLHKLCVCILQNITNSFTTFFILLATAERTLGIPSDFFLNTNISMAVDFIFY